MRGGPWVLRGGICDGNMIANATRGQGGRPQLRYICSTHKHRGDTACSNKYGVSVAGLDAAVLEQLRHHLDWAVITDRLNGLIETPANHEAERQAVAAQVADLDRKLQNLADAIEATGNDPVLVGRIVDARQQRDEAAAKLEHLEGVILGALANFTTEEGRRAWAEDIGPRLENLLATLQGDPAKARQRLREVLSGTISVTPRVVFDGVLYFDILGISSFEAVKVPLDDGLVHGKLTVMRPVMRQLLAKRRSVAGMWWPRGDSNTRHAV